MSVVDNTKYSIPKFAVKWQENIFELVIKVYHNITDSDLEI